MVLSRANRNCNPGNIRIGTSRFKGEVIPSTDKAFKQFESPEWGYRAMFLLIHNYDVLYGINTLDKIIERWAPFSENPTNQYIATLARRLGVAKTAYINSLDHDIMVAFVSGIAWIESGQRAVTDDVENGWDLFIEGRESEIIADNK